MDQNLMPLSKLPIGACAKVKKLNMKGSNRRRMLDLGITMNTIIEALQKSPSGDPTAYQIRGAVIALRTEETSDIIVKV